MFGQKVPVTSSLFKLELARLRSVERHPKPTAARETLNNEIVRGRETRLRSSYSDTFPLFILNLQAKHPLR